MEKVKFAALGLCIASSAAEAQSPYLSVSAMMDVSLNSSKQFLIQMKICRPVEMTNTGDWFTHDTSKVRFTQLRREEVECGNYAIGGEGEEWITGNPPKKANSYSFSNQVFAWENILVFRITEVVHQGVTEPSAMYVFLPVRYKSFITSIIIEKIPFMEGKVLDLSNALGAYVDGRLKIRCTGEQGTAVSIEKFEQWEWMQ